MRLGRWISEQTFSFFSAALTLKHHNHVPHLGMSLFENQKVVSASLQSDRYAILSPRDQCRYRRIRVRPSPIYMIYKALVSVMSILCEHGERLKQKTPYPARDVETMLF